MSDAPSPGDWDAPAGLHFLQYQEPDSNLLFHYTSASTLAAILDSGNMRLGSYSRTNDPRETKEWEPTITLPDVSVRPAEKYLHSTKEDYRKVVDAVNGLLRRGARLACFTSDSDRTSSQNDGTLFHRGWARARMWQQYADAHRGACLVFDRSKLIENADLARPHSNEELFTYGAVNYEDAPLTINLRWMDVVDQGIEAVLSDLQTWKGVATHLYATKNTDWESEHESRITVVIWNVPDDSADEPIDVPIGDSLKAIVFGDDFPDVERSVAQSRFAAGNEPDVLTCHWSNGVPWLSPNL
jgi:hypothetical protein